jgi:hypothetical protein
MVDAYEDYQINLAPKVSVQAMSLAFIPTHENFC